MPHCNLSKDGPQSPHYKGRVYIREIKGRVYISILLLLRRRRRRSRRFLFFFFFSLYSIVHTAPKNHKNLSFFLLTTPNQPLSY